MDRNELSRIQYEFAKVNKGASGVRAGGRQSELALANRQDIIIKTIQDLLSFLQDLQLEPEMHAE